jgi:CO dehydrogenase/acetyl-CoA synthase beta subunit
MLRNSSAVAPTGENWDMLANRAGGKQSAGITGVSLAYIRSPQFLRGDGGLDNVVWVDHALYEKLADRFPPDQRVATEQDVDTIDELARFLDRRPTQETPADLSS